MGAGSSGCVLANRLSASGAIACCCSRPGRATTTSGFTSPMGYSRTMLHPVLNWRFLHRARSGPGGRQNLLAARQGARRLAARSTACSTSAARARTSTLGSPRQSRLGLGRRPAALHQSEGHAARRQPTCAAAHGRSSGSRTAAPRSADRCLHRRRRRDRHSARRSTTTATSRRAPAYFQLNKRNGGIAAARQVAFLDPARGRAEPAHRNRRPPRAW